MGQTRTRLRRAAHDNCQDYKSPDLQEKKAMSYLRDSDPEIYQAILDETGRQSNQLELIASENFVSEAVMEAVGGVMTNKYAEGYPGRRYYGGCEFVVVGEKLGRGPFTGIFGCEKG